MSLARRCPICSCTRARPVWYEQQLRYVRCSLCRLVFSDVDSAAYAAAAHNVWHDDELEAETEAFYGTARARAHQQLLQRLEPGDSRRLLDVGCGLGYFLQRAAAAGWSAYGCDTSEPWVRRAGATTGTPERIARSEPRAGLFGGGFDLITVWDVLEHIHDPLPFLRAVTDLLVPGGHVFIRTPNIGWVYPTYVIRRHLLGAKVSLGPLNHVVYYSSRTLSRALTAAGLRALCWPVLPPPQVGIGNRDPGSAGERSAGTLFKNTHAAAADRLARATGGRVVAGADLDVIAART